MKKMEGLCEGDAKEEVACNENPCAGTAFFVAYFDSYYTFQVFTFLLLLNDFKVLQDGMN